MRAQFSTIVAHGHAFKVDFYHRLFELASDVRLLFRDDMTEQGDKLMRMLALIVAKAESPTDLTEPLAQLGARHVSYGVTTAHFAAMEESLMTTLAAHLGNDFDAEARHC